MLYEVSDGDTFLPGLYTTEPADLPFMQGVEVRSYLIRTGDRLISIYNSPGLSQDRNAILELDKPSALLMSHWHEAMYKAPQLDVAAYVATADLPRTKASMPKVEDLSDYLDRDETVKIIATPGHTLGFSMFLWTCGEHRVLFSGDMIWSHNPRWEAVVLGESNRQRYISSLEVIAELDFDVLIPWVSLRGAQRMVATNASSARRKVLDIVQRLKCGESA